MQDTPQGIDCEDYGFREEPNPEGTGTSVVLRIARGSLHAQAMEKLKEVFGPSIRVITATDVLFTADPSDDVLFVIDALTEKGLDVVAVDLVAPPAVKEAVVQSPDIINTGIPVIAQVLERDWDKEPIVIGQDPKTRRDMLKVLRYVELTPPPTEK